MGLTDIFKVKDYKLQVEKLFIENKKLNEDFIKLKEVQLNIQQMTLMELQTEIDSRTHEKEELEKEIQLMRTEVSEKQKYISSYHDRIKDLERQLTATTEDINMETYGLYRPKYDFATALGYKDKLSEIRNQQKELIRTKRAVNFFENWTVDGSKAKGKKMTNDNIKIMLRAFNNECEAAINKVKYSNIQIIKDRITNSFEQINKLNEVNKCDITNQFYNLKISELYLAYEYERKKEDEREELREQREKEREDKALQKEIDSKKKLIDKDIKHINNVIDELELKLTIANEEEKEAISIQIQELKDSLNKYEEDKEELDYRLMNASAGYVYIISNIGSFGEGVFKIGVTRRLDPLDRIRELSSASVPFKFDIHALIFSYDAYKLESDLHNRFEKSRLNIVNNRKEFYKLDITDIKIELEKYKDLTIDFKEIPEAEEFRESLKSLIN